MTALGLYGRPDVAEDQWWPELVPYLSPQARHDYLGVDPRRVPITEITDEAREVDLETDYVAIVHVLTDAGLYAVTLSREDVDAPWLVDRFTPPEDDPHEGEEGW